MLIEPAQRVVQNALVGGDPHLDNPRLEAVQ